RPPHHRTTVFPYTTLFRSPERLRLSRQLAPDFVLDGLWQGFRVPTLGYVDRHTLRVQHVAMVVLRGLLFGHRSGPGDELVADHLDRKSTRLNSSHLVISYA